MKVTPNISQDFCGQIYGLLMLLIAPVFLFAHYKAVFTVWNDHGQYTKIMVNISQSNFLPTVEIFWSFHLFIAFCTAAAILLFCYKRRRENATLTNVQKIYDVGSLYGIALMVSLIGPVIYVLLYVTTIALLASICLGIIVGGLVLCVVFLEANNMLGVFTGSLGMGFLYLLQLSAYDFSVLVNSTLTLIFGITIVAFVEWILSEYRKNHLSFQRV